LRGCPEVGSNLAWRSGVRAPNCPYGGPVDGLDDVFGGEQVGLPHLKVDGVKLPLGELYDLAYARDEHGAGARRGRRGHLTGSGGDLLGGHGLPPLYAPHQVIDWQVRLEASAPDQGCAGARDRSGAHQRGTREGDEGHSECARRPPLARLLRELRLSLSLCAAGRVVFGS